MENNQPKKDDISVSPFIPDTMVQPVQRKSHLDKLAEVFLPEDLDSIGKRVFDQVVIPNILKSAGDILHKSIDLIFGTNYSGINTQSSSPTAAAQAPSDFTSYRQQPQTNQRPGTMQIMNVRTGVYEYADVRFRSLQDAENVVNNMRAVVASTGSCSVGKYLDFANARTMPEDFNYGWTNLNNVNAEDTGDPAYPIRLVLPPTVALTKIRRTYQL